MVSSQSVMVPCHSPHCSSTTNLAAQVLIQPLHSRLLPSQRVALLEELVRPLALRRRRRRRRLPLPTPRPQAQPARALAALARQSPAALHSRQHQTEQVRCRSCQLLGEPCSGCFCCGCQLSTPDSCCQLAAQPLRLRRNARHGCRRPCWPACAARCRLLLLKLLLELPCLLGDCKESSSVCCCLRCCCRRANGAHTHALASHQAAGVAKWSHRRQWQRQRRPRPALLRR